MTRTAHPQLHNADHIALTERWAAHNYSPLPVVVSEALGCWVNDADGHRYLDCLAGYSALNFGHRHPRLVAVAHEQLDRLTLTSRAFYNDQLGLFARDLARLTGTDVVLPMNTGSEAVETAIKVSRRWGYEIKGVPDDSATIVVMQRNFHGRTTTIVSFSDDPEAHRHYGPYTPGFRMVPFGDIGALAATVDETTVAVLLEPIQGESGVIIPPDGYLREVRALCSAERVLMVADEVQSGLGRTGETLACDHEDVAPDLIVLGKALGGGIYPVSAVAGSHDVLSVVVPGSHGSTFGGNPLAAAIGREVVALLETGQMQERARELGGMLADGLRSLVGSGLAAVRTRGLWAGIDVDPSLLTGRELCEALARRHVLAKDTHGQTIRLAPPLVATESDIEFLLEALHDALDGAGSRAGATHAAGV